MTDHKTPEDQMLDALFSEAQQEAISPSEALLARIMMDAETERDLQQASVEMLRSEPGIFEKCTRAINEALGGWRGLAGVATAGVAGLVIGLGAPDAVSSLTDGYVSYETEGLTVQTGEAVDVFLSSFDGLAVEG